MRRSCSAALLVLLTSFQTFAQESETEFLRRQLDLPFTALFNREGLRFESRILKSVRSSLQQERDSQTRECRRSEDEMKESLATSRKTLKTLNESSDRDNTRISTTRKELHEKITGLEAFLHDKQQECEHTIPSVYEVKLAKLDVLQHWPERRKEIAKQIDNGQARLRTHGDVDDIGFRVIAGNQEEDIPIGEQTLRQLSAAGMMPTEVRYLSVRQYMDHFAAKLAGTSDLKVPIHVTVVDSPEIKVTTLPGGFVFLTSGALRACETESELAGILSQQIAHVAARHDTRHSKLSAASKFFVPVAQLATGVFTAGVGNATVHYGTDLAVQGVGELTNRAFTSSTEKSKSEDDQLGIQYAWSAGYDPMGFTAYLDSLSRRSDYSQTSKILLAKPPLSSRVLDAFSEIEYLPGKESYLDSSAEFRSIQKLLQP